MEPTVNCTRIDLPFISTTKRTVNSVKECYLLLFDTYLQYKIVAEYTEEDDDTGIPTVCKSNYRWTRLKSSLVDVDMYRDRKENKYSVDIEFNGINGPVGWLFNSPEEALSIYNQLVQYLIS